MGTWPGGNLNDHGMTYEDNRLESEAQIDPLYDVEQGFPWQEIFTAMDGPEDPPANDLDAARFVRALRVIFSFVTAPVKTNRASAYEKQRQVANRTAAVVYVVSPDIVDGISAAEIGRRLGTNREAISSEACEFTRMFGIRSRRQAQGRNGLHAETLRPANREPLSDILPTAALMECLDALAKAPPEPTGAQQEVSL